MLKALVTGGAGFIGSALCEALIQSGNSVAVVDDLSTGHKSNLHSRVEFLEGSVCDADLMAHAVRGCDIVYHLAAIVDVAKTFREPSRTTLVNVGGTVTSLEAARREGISRFVFASSAAVYGATTSLPIDELDALSPMSPYAASKLAGETYAAMFSQVHRMSTISLRLFNVFGPKQRFDEQYAAVVPSLIQQAQSTGSVDIHGSGDQTRDFIFIDDVVKALRSASMRQTPRVSGTVFNVGSGSETSVMELSLEVFRLLGLRPQFSFSVRRESDLDRSCADVARASSVLDWKPEVDWRSGLARTVYQWQTPDV